MVAGPWVISGFHRGDAAAPIRVAGGALIAAGAVVVLWCCARFVRGGGTPSPLAPPRQLVAGGPYARSRNPMYLATAAVIAGEGALLGRVLLVACAALYLVAMAALVVAVEEPLLRRRHGAGWDAYARAVPRWLWRAQATRRGGHG